MIGYRVFGRFVASLCVLLALCVVASAGGFFIIGESPSGEEDTKDSVLIVSVMGCHELGQIYARAEGLIDNERKSIPLQLEPLGEGRYRIMHTWPKQGVWGISVYALSKIPISLKGNTVHVRDAAFFLCGTDGRPEKPANSYEYQGKPRWFVRPKRLTPDITTKAQQIDATLRLAAQSANVTGAIAAR